MTARGSSTSTCSSWARASPGIGGACHLQEQRPGTTLRHRSTPSTASAARGGRTATPACARTATCSRSATGFKPWLGPPIASAEEILQLPRRGHRRARAEAAHPLPAPRRLRRVVVRRQPLDGHRDAAPTPTRSVAITAGFVWMCQGYYRHNTGYTPEWPGFDDFAGEVIHPQEWPDDVDLTGKRVVVIGSGATAATLIPNIADDCAHVTMLQRSPTFFIVAAEQQRAGRHAARPRHPRRVDPRDRPPPDPQDDQDVITKMSFEEPETAAPVPPRGDPRRCCPRASTSTATSTRRYRPWQQRIAVAARRRPLQVRSQTGQASVVTDQIDDVHRARHPPGVGRRARGRRDHHGHRLRPQRDGRRRLRRRRPEPSTGPTRSRTAA